MVVKFMMPGHCLFFCRWVEIATKGVTKYEECHKCRSRKVTQPDLKTPLPYDRDWLRGRD